jgi:hypothetical protein
MLDPNLFLTFIEPLNKLGVTYMVSGSVAMIAYGEPRVTHDIDLILLLSTATIPLFENAFPLKDFYIPPAEVIEVEARRESRGHFNILHHRTGFKADVYIVAGDPLHKWGLAHRTMFNLQGHQMPIAPPEYVIVRKLEYYAEGNSDKHLQDIRKILHISGDRINIPQLKQFIAARRLDHFWDKVTANS